MPPAPVTSKRGAGGVQSGGAGVLVDRARLRPGTPVRVPQPAWPGWTIAQVSGLYRPARYVGESTSARTCPVEKPSLPRVRGVAQPVDLMGLGGDRQHAGALPLRVEPEALDIGLHAVEVL